MTNLPSEERLSTRRFQFRMVDLLAVTVVVALTVAAAKEGPINGAEHSPILLVLLAGMFGAITGRIVSGAVRIGFVAGLLLGVVGYLFAVVALSLGIKITDRPLFLVCVCAGGVTGGLIPTMLRRWSLASARSRICLLLIGLTSLVFPAVQLWKVSEQSRVVAELEAAGAIVGYSDSDRFPTIIDSSRMQSRSAWLQKMLGLRVITRVTLTEKVDHRYAIQLLVDKLPFVQDLRLHADHMNDATFEFLNTRQLPRLDHLRFTGRGFGDASLSRLRPLPNLLILDLDGTSVTEESVEHIATFPRLIGVDVRHTDFTPEGVEYLKSKIGRVISSN